MMLPFILVIALGCMALEKAVPGWALPKVKTWPLRVVLINLIQVGVVLLAGISWERWASAWSFFQLGQVMNPILGGLVAYFIATFVFYWWHRFRHTNDWLWRHFHQIHHSPQRLEVITSFYKHPLEMIVNSIIGSLLVYTLLGLSPEAGAIYTLCTALGEFFYHTNVKTPRWVGYFFQRPEMHRIHHKFHYHRNNYGDIVWWDMLFGTYENPAEFHGTCGFEGEREEQLLPMLAFRDVHKKRKISSGKPAMMVVLGILSAMAFYAPKAEACTSFRFHNLQGDVMVAKNYDWPVAEGYVVKMPRNMQHHTLQGPGVPQKPFNWTSRYASLAFTQFGVGLTISGMNEKGLVVETLVNKDRSPSIKGSLGGEAGLVSLQWVQYQLDTAADLDQVIDSLARIRIIQVLEPVHFLVCDQSAQCAVIEVDSSGRAYPAQRFKASDAAALANRDWSAKGSRITFKPTDLLLSASSGKRFAKAQHLSRVSLSEEEAFQGLFAAKIPGLTRWQLIWNLNDKSVDWRVLSPSMKPLASERARLNSDTITCQDGFVQAAPIGEWAQQEPGFSLHARDKIDQNLMGTMKKIFAVRGGAASAEAWIESLQTMRRQQSCQ